MPAQVAEKLQGRLKQNQAMQNTEASRNRRRLAEIEARADTLTPTACSAANRRAPR